MVPGGLPEATLSQFEHKIDFRAMSRAKLAQIETILGPQKIDFSGTEPLKKNLGWFLVRIFMVPGRFGKPSNIEPKWTAKKVLQQNLDTFFFMF